MSLLNDEGGQVCRQYINMEEYLGCFKKDQNILDGLIIHHPDKIDYGYPCLYIYSNNKLISTFDLNRFDSRSARTIELERVAYMKKINGISYNFMWFNNPNGDVNNTARVESVGSLNIENFWNISDLSPFLDNYSTTVRKDHILYCKEYDVNTKQVKIKCKRHDIIDVPDDGTAESLILPDISSIPTNVQSIWDEFIKGQYLTSEYKIIIQKWFSKNQIIIKI
jgi:hypothetical protein